MAGEDRVDPASLRDREWPPNVSSPSRQVVTDLYAPALAVARTYDRQCAYFSSSVLAAAVAGFRPFLGRLADPSYAGPRPAIRLVVNEALSPEDAAALMGGGDTAPLAAHLLARLGERTDTGTDARLSILAWLVREGLLHVRVGVMRRGNGINHAKFGLVTDARGDTLLFHGSANETASGIASNYEEFDISVSWGGRTDERKVASYASKFETMWADRHEHVHVLDLPDAVRQQLIRLAPETPPVGVDPDPPDPLAKGRALARWAFLLASPYLADGMRSVVATAPVDAWPHQLRVVNDLSREWPAGRLLCDEVGMGKTIEGSLALRALMTGRGVGRALLLVPAGLLRQWQGEVKEKAGLEIPRWEGGQLIRPDETVDTRVQTLEKALEEPVLLMSRELARRKAYRDVVLGATPWDLVLIDEAHHARRREKDPRAFNSANELLSLARDLPLAGAARGVVLMSATPMQTDPWEPWDLLVPLGVGGAWQSSFENVAGYFRCIGQLEGGQRPSPGALGRQASALAVSTGAVPPAGLTALDSGGGLPTGRRQWADWLRTVTPLSRRMHRHTRGLLGEYFRRGLVRTPPPTRKIESVSIVFDTAAEREAYEAVRTYIDTRYDVLESERPGKGFVMVIYQRRAASSWGALRATIAGRRDALMRQRAAIAASRADLTAVSAAITGLDVGVGDLEDLDDIGEGIDPGLPPTMAGCDAELDELATVKAKVDALGGADTKARILFRILRDWDFENRPTLVFSGFADTIRYLRDDWLASHWGDGLATYTGDGGERHVNGAWVRVRKDEITTALAAGEIRVLLCTDAASEGLNLQAAGALINYDLPWNPSRIEQRIGRIDRIGQKFADIAIRNFYIEDSIDRRVYEVLDARCNLFKDFVGPMQPILAKARQLLVRRLRPADLEAALRALESDADRIRGDTMTASAYTTSDTAALEELRRLDGSPEPPPAVTRADIASALAHLDATGTGISARVLDDGVWRLVTPSGTHRIALTQQALELHADARPFGPGTALWDEVEATITGAMQGTPVPVVAGQASDGPFRQSRVAWAGSPGDAIPLTDWRGTGDLVDAWSGWVPDASSRSAMAGTLDAQASAAVRAAVSRARAIEREALDEHLAAARLRIRRACAVLLETLAPRADWNATWQGQPGRGVGKMLQDALAHLGGRYPEWSHAEHDEVAKYVDGLTAPQQTGLRTGSELTAALADPRWQAGETLARLWGAGTA